MILFRIAVVVMMLLIGADFAIVAGTEGKSNYRRINDAFMDLYLQSPPREQIEIYYHHIGICRNA